MVFKKVYLLVFAIAVIFAACSKEESGNEVIYRVTLESQWSEANYPEAFPSNAGFSPFVAFSHAEYIQLFDTENLASPGLKALAEEGSINPLDQEVQELIDAGNAFDLVTSTHINAAGIASTELKVSNENSTVSIVSKITPSPDWFVSAKNIQLFENNEWVDKIETVVIYDAGTVAGTSFYEPNTPRTAPIEVSELIGGPLNPNDSSILGTVRFERVK